MAFDKTTLLFAIVRLSYIRGKMAIDFWICAWVRFTIGFSGGSCFFAFFAFLPFLLGSFSVLGLSAFLVCFCLFYFLLFAFLCSSVLFVFCVFLLFCLLPFLLFCFFLLVLLRGDYAFILTGKMHVTSLMGHVRGHVLTQKNMIMIKLPLL